MINALYHPFPNLGHDIKIVRGERWGGGDNQFHQRLQLVFLSKTRRGGLLVER